MASPGEPAVRRDDDEQALESVIRKRYEPERAGWLAALQESSGGPAPDPALLQRAQRHLMALHRVSERLAGARDLEGVSAIALEAILEVIEADRAALVLRREDPQTGGAELAATRTRGDGDLPVNVSRALVADVIDKGVSRFARDARREVELGPDVAAGRARSMMCVPLRTTGQILGAVYVDTVNAPDRFTEADLELLAAIGNQAGVALHRVRLMSELGRLHLDTIRAIAATIDAKDGYTHRHSERVAALAGRLAAELGLSPEEQQTAELAALLHDLGKIAVPDSILNKPEQLSADEFAEMKKHPVHGAGILANIQSAAVMAVIPGVQYHHEWWDGTGYPEGLRGEEIPLLGRLLGVADFLDALTSSRSYRQPLAVDAAIRMVAEGAGTHFDPRVVEAALRLHERGELL
jgi:putative nucleotidyltransferase with HDIG domain